MSNTCIAPYLSVATTCTLLRDVLANKNVSRHAACIHSYNMLNVVMGSLNRGDVM